MKFYSAGVAYWYCNAQTLTFEPTQPNRLGCLPKWIDVVEEMANTVDSDPKNITSTILENVSNFTVPQLQITSGTLFRLIDVAKLLPERMRDPANAATYLTNVTRAVDIAGDFVEITSDLFNHELAWEEEDRLPCLANATALMRRIEDLGFFAVEVGVALDGVIGRQVDR